MNQLVYQYFYEGENFEEALILSEQPEKTWDDLIVLMPELPRGWYELSRLPVEDRIEFSRDFWLKALPYRPSIHNAIVEFFAGLDDVGLVLSLNGKWTPQLVYSFRDNSCFFRGFVPALDKDLTALGREMHFPFPKDWNAFMKIHNGFGKLLEPGILPIENIESAKNSVDEMIINADTPIQLGSSLVNPNALMPFYETFGLNSFQCFFLDWYPEGEMGNVYFSGIDYTVSDITRRKEWSECGAFVNFSEWLVSFLEGMDVDL